jgi:hypothetical protein
MSSATDASLDRSYPCKRANGQGLTSDSRPRPPACPLAKDVVTISGTTRACQPKDTTAATLANLLKNDWHEMTAAANASGKHVKSLDRWIAKAHEANPSLNDDQAERLAVMMRKAHFVRMGRLSVQARKLARQAQAELDQASADESAA